MQFFPGPSILEHGQRTEDFPDYRSTQKSPLARSLFKVSGVERVFLGPDFVTVTKSTSLDWNELKPQIFSHITTFFSSGEPAVLEQAINPDTAADPADSETVAMIKELLDTRIRPAVQEDGGDIHFERFDVEEGIVWLRMVGACSGCSSSSITLKNGVENMLMHYVQEVREVREVLDDVAVVNEEEVKKVDEKVAH